MITSLKDDGTKAYAPSTGRMYDEKEKCEGNHYKKPLLP